MLISRIFIKSVLIGALQASVNKLPLFIGFFINLFFVDGSSGTGQGANVDLFVLGSGCARSAVSSAEHSIMLLTSMLDRHPYSLTLSPH